jgi:hypothetical protein
LVGFRTFGCQHFSTLPALKSAENFAFFDTLLDIFLKYFRGLISSFTNFDAKCGQTSKKCVLDLKLEAIARLVFLFSQKVKITAL